MNISNYKCPACGAPIHFSEKSGKIECEYCGSSYEVAEIEALFENKNENKSDEGNSTKEESNSENTETMNIYNCPSCGAELYCDKSTVAANCPYCDNPVVMSGEFKIEKPDYILPFKLDKNAAISSLKSHYKGKLLLPKIFSEQNHLEEIKGVYVPFWLFDSEVSGAVSYHGTKSTIHREGDYKVTDTAHYNIYRAGNMQFERVPVDGSEKMPDDYMDSIEPYDYSELKPYSPAYFPGFLANKADVHKNTCWERAKKRCHKTAISSFRDTVSGYGTLNEISKNLNVKNNDIKYALMPVWLLTTKWQDKTYLFAMNGQTGKLVGNLPVDKNKARMLFILVGIVAGILLSLFFSAPIGRFFEDLFL